MVDCESTFCIFSGCLNLVMDLQIDVVVSIFENGRLLCSMSCLLRAQYIWVWQIGNNWYMLARCWDACWKTSIHSSSHIYKSISHSVSNSLDVSLSIYFILSLFPPLILLHLNPGPTSTLTYPSSFDFPLTTHQSQIDINANTMSSMRYTIVKFIISLSKASPLMVRNNMA